MNDMLIFEPGFYFAVSGLGFGMMSGLFAMVNILADITGPGTVGLYGDYKDFLVVTGRTSLSQVGQEYQPFEGCIFTTRNF